MPREFRRGFTRTAKPLTIYCDEARVSLSKLSNDIVAKKMDINTALRTGQEAADNKKRQDGERLKKERRGSF
jgi:hypothetical protein